MELTPQLQQQFSDIAATISGIDTAVYQQAERDPLFPIIANGPAAAPIAFFGRDPGKDEVIQQIPFIGAGGQKVRAALYRHHYNAELPDFAASVAVGEHYFWANTVPYKPIGNKAWSMQVKKQFQPLITSILEHHWQGKVVITLGREAFFWFAIGRDKTVKQKLEQFWQREDRFSATILLPFGSGDSQRHLVLAPLPHPSPLNATWYKRFPDLLLQRLQQLH